MDLPSLSLNPNISEELQSFLRQAAPIPGPKRPRKKSWRIGLIGHGIDRTNRSLMGKVLAQRALSEQQFQGQDDTALALQLDELFSSSDGSERYLMMTARVKEKRLATTRSNLETALHWMLAGNCNILVINLPELRRKALRNTIYEAGLDKDLQCVIWTNDDPENYTFDFIQRSISWEGTLTAGRQWLRTQME